MDIKITLKFNDETTNEITVSGAEVDINVSRNNKHISVRSNPTAPSIDFPFDKEVIEFKIYQGETILTSLIKAENTYLEASYACNISQSNEARETIIATLTKTTV